MNESRYLDVDIHIYLCRQTPISIQHSYHPHSIAQHATQHNTASPTGLASAPQPTEQKAERVARCATIQRAARRGRGCRTTTHATPPQHHRNTIAAHHRPCAMAGWLDGQGGTRRKEPDVGGRGGGQHSAPPSVFPHQPTSRPVPREEAQLSTPRLLNHHAGYCLSSCKAPPPMGWAAWLAVQAGRAWWRHIYRCGGMDVLCCTYGMYMLSITVQYIRYVCMYVCMYVCTVPISCLHAPADDHGQPTVHVRFPVLYSVSFSPTASSSRRI